jgi:hypothetical protein
MYWEVSGHSLLPLHSGALDSHTLAFLGCLLFHSCVLLITSLPSPVCLSLQGGCSLLQAAVLTKVLP